MIPIKGYYINLNKRTNRKEHFEALKILKEWNLLNL